MYAAAKLTSGDRAGVVDVEHDGRRPITIALNAATAVTPVK